MAGILQKILCCVGVVNDHGKIVSSPGSVRAMAVCAELARRSNGIVHLVYVVPPLTMEVAGFRRQADPSNPARQIWAPLTGGSFERISPEEEARRNLGSEAEPLMAGVNHKVVIRVGDPARRILEVADEQDVDLIVCSRTRKGSSGDTMLGSVPQKIVNSTSRSVMAVQ